MLDARRNALIGAAALVGLVSVWMPDIRRIWQRTGLPRIVLIGDSTVADQSQMGSMLAGWGETLETRLSGRFQVLNLARSGSSAARFWLQSWPVVRAHLRRGDMLLMQFGHIDALPDPGYHSAPRPAYQAALGEFVQQALACGAKPVVCTPVASHRFEMGRWVYAFTAYADAAIELAQQHDLPLIDLGHLVGRRLEQLGEQAARAWFMIAFDGHDRLHLSRFGAAVVAAIVESELTRLGLVLAHIPQHAQAKARG